VPAKSLLDEDGGAMAEETPEHVGTRQGDDPDWTGAEDGHDVHRARGGEGGEQAQRRKSRPCKRPVESGGQIDLHHTVPAPAPEFAEGDRMQGMVEKPAHRATEELRHADDQSVHARCRDGDFEHDQLIVEEVPELRGLPKPPSVTENEQTHTRTDSRAPGQGGEHRPSDLPRAGLKHASRCDQLQHEVLDAGLAKARDARGRDHAKAEVAYQQPQDELRRPRPARQERRRASRRQGPDFDRSTHPAIGRPSRRQVRDAQPDHDGQQQKGERKREHRQGHCTRGERSSTRATGAAVPALIDSSGSRTCTPAHRP
jgi:hypothetical protein